MIIWKTILIFTLLFGSTLSQTGWNRYASWYELRIFRVNDGYQVPYHHFKNENDTVFYNAVHDTINPIYESPYTSFLWKKDTTFNDTSLWDDDTIRLHSIVDWPSGSYELTLHEIMYLDSFWIDGEMILDSLLEGHSTNALYIRIDLSDVPLSIDLTFFEAVLIDGIVSLAWITESELNNAGFNLYRKEYRKEKIKLNQKLIPGNNNSSRSHNYGYIDDTVLSGKSYIYILESVSYSGVVEEEGRFSIFVPIIYGIHLAQNYPNPFNSTTTIEFSIDERSEVNLIVYDVQGKRTITIIDEMYDTGGYKIGIDASDIASGTYFYFLRVHNMRTRAVRMLSKKLTVIK